MIEETEQSEVVHIFNKLICRLNLFKFQNRFYEQIEDLL